ncbi:MAG: hypothetical protein ACI8SK_001044 [Shewanella sp.]|jgi:hypothetical protein
MLIKLICLSLSLTFTSSTFAIEIFQWVDKDGVTHYSQQPPKNNSSNKIYSEDLEQKPIGSVQPKIRESTTPVQSEDEKNAATIKKQNTEQATALCESAKQNLKILTSHSRLKSKDEKTGGLVMMKEEDRQQEIKNQKKRIKLFCDQSH